eukprot:scaffold2150_cov137-Isochrysis_galbana.AAC.5
MCPNWATSKRLAIRSVMERVPAASRIVRLESLIDGVGLGLVERGELFVVVELIEVDDDEPPCMLSCIGGADHQTHHERPYAALPYTHTRRRRGAERERQVRKATLSEIAQRYLSAYLTLRPYPPRLCACVSKQSHHHGEQLRKVAQESAKHIEDLLRDRRRWWRWRRRRRWAAVSKALSTIILRVEGEAVNGGGGDGGDGGGGGQQYSKQSEPSLTA